MRKIIRTCAAVMAVVALTAGVPKEVYAFDDTMDAGYEVAEPAGGPTYIDVSIDNQTLTYFINGVPALVTPCVTGGPGHGTPRGMFAINSCIPGKYLNGPTWHVWVNRWMRFAGNCGIHDASWHRNFGGDIYMHNGSHGCVNIPPDQATQLYNMVGIGTVVVVH